MERDQMRGIRMAAATVTIVGWSVLLMHAAVADTPIHGSFDEPSSGTDPAGTTCSFPVHFTQDQAGRYTIFVDGRGELLRVEVHITYVATISANGKELYERDRFTRTLYPDGTYRDAGLTVHLRGLQGTVLRDAGQIAYLDQETDTVVYVRGPHPSLGGAGFCESLAP